MMQSEPTKCPKCGHMAVSAVGERTSGVSLGKAAIGGILLGPVGLLGGALGKKKIIYQCKNCGYTIEK